MNRTYEVMFIIRPDLEEGEQDKLVEGFEKNVTDGGGEVLSTEKLGRRRLAYTVRKFNDGFYVLLTIAADGKLVLEVERRLRVSEQVLKFITVRTDEENKRLAKVKALRDSKVKRSAQPVAQPVAAAEAPAAEAEATPAPLTPSQTGSPSAEGSAPAEAAVVADAPAAEAAPAEVSA